MLGKLIGAVTCDHERLYMTMDNFPKTTYYCKRCDRRVYNPGSDYVFNDGEIVSRDCYDNTDT